MELLDSLQSNLGKLIGRQIGLLKGSSEVFGKLDNVIIDVQSGVTLIINGAEHTLTSTVRRLDVREHTITFMDDSVLRLTVPSDAMPKSLAVQGVASGVSPAGQIVQPGQQQPHDHGSYHPS